MRVFTIRAVVWAAMTWYVVLFWTAALNGKSAPERECIMQCEQGSLGWVIASEPPCASRLNCNASFFTESFSDWDVELRICISVMSMVMSCASISDLCV